MNKEIFISTRGNTHAVAVVEGGKLVEFNSENEEDASIVGNIYKGRVEQAVKGMQAVFVNIGRKKNGYLFLGETIIDGEDISLQENVKVNSSLNLEAGDTIMVQISKTEIGQKGARLVSNISIAGRFLVYMPMMDYIGVSRKIVDEKERERLMGIVSNLHNRSGGYIIRTICEGAGEEELKRDAELLKKKWEYILKKYEETEQTKPCYFEGGILFRCVRDIANREMTTIIVDNPNTFLKMRDNLREEGIDTSKLSLFEDKKKDLFNYYGLTASILRVLDSKFELENGAYLVIEKTEALTVIDVNTGRFVGTNSLEETVFETNMLAAKAIAAQLRLRNIGGIIIVDFIDMNKEEHKEQVLEKLRECVQRDRTRTSVVDMTPLGLVEITRKKSRTEVGQKLSKPCSVCGGKGYVMTNETLTSLIKAKLFDLFSDKTVTGVQINLSTKNAEEFFSMKALTFEISIFWQNKRIYVYPDPKKNMESFEIKAFHEDTFEVSENARLLY